MSLITGVIFEGIYQLEERVSGGEHGQPSRWRADDITSYRRSEVIIDTIPAEYTANLHWQADVPGLKLAGQSVESQCRYTVWDKDQAPPPPAIQESVSLNGSARKRLADLIDAIPVTAHESLVAGALPEYWYYKGHGLVLFYRKAAATDSAQASEYLVKEDWKQALLPQPAEPIKITPDSPAKPASFYWPFLLSVIGVMLAAGVYTLRSQPGARVAQSEDANRLRAFNNSFERGIANAQRAAYQEAVENFEKAVGEAPVSEAIDARLDSLARAYTAYARAECARYRSTGSTRLYFIPDQYFHYAAILSRNPTIDTCK